MAEYRIAQVNIGRIKVQLDDPVMAGLVTIDWSSFQRCPGT
jgi:hypothetical protein